MKYSLTRLGKAVGKSLALDHFAQTSHQIFPHLVLPHSLIAAKQLNKFMLGDLAFFARNN